MEEALQRITGHTVAKIREDFQRDFYLSSSEAVQYGIIDKVLLPREKTRQDMYKARGVSARISYVQKHACMHAMTLLLSVVCCCWWWGSWDGG